MYLRIYNAFVHFSQHTTRNNLTNCNCKININSIHSKKQNTNNNLKSFQHVKSPLISMKQKKCKDRNIYHITSIVWHKYILVRINVSLYE